MFRSFADYQTLFILGGAAFVAAAMPAEDAQHGAVANDVALRTDEPTSSPLAENHSAAAGQLNELHSGATS